MTTSKLKIIPLGGLSEIGKNMMALEYDMIGITMTNANPLVAPTFSISRLLGTNPVAVAIPAKKQPAFVADFSTTPIARGKLAVAEKKDEI